MVHKQKKCPDCKRMVVVFPRDGYAFFSHHRIGRNMCGTSGMRVDDVERQEWEKNRKYAVEIELTGMGQVVIVGVYMDMTELEREVYKFRYKEKEHAMILQTYTRLKRSSRRHGWGRVAGKGNFDLRNDTLEHFPDVPEKVFDLAFDKFMESLRDRSLKRHLIPMEDDQ